ncbi:hypothetical protein G6O69_17950 [Pseudenhygromyxa sp. WMMC2535]|uniref:hypothetical protein n=1 Tax=Pseudenhygromyxa sp. WMMC2535 TaxID=2712867 RepID=UPI0015564DD8|nr:hypothetical protein [Pseudenhygromyxa sp. WMMC2535]NVB39732.1 hypothetical protein [Pseudenhygromyxa sp. WMMC2535]
MEPSAANCLTNDNCPGRDGCITVTMSVAHRRQEAVLLSGSLAARPLRFARVRRR